MAEALVSLAVEQLDSILASEVGLVVGVEEEVTKLKGTLSDIQAVLTDAERRQARDANVRNWLEKLKDVAYDIEDVLDDWEAAIRSSQRKPGDERDPKRPERKVCSFLRSSCFCCRQLGLRHDIARKIKKLNERLDRIAQEKDRYQFVQREGNPPNERFMTTSMIDVAEVTGREEEKNLLVNMLLREPSDGDVSNFHVLSIVGMGGIGKTTLAQFAFNHDRIKAEFDKRIWVCVSDPFDETRVAKAILTGLQGSTPDVTELQDLFQKIRESIENKKFLLILDDVWEENSKKWDQLKLCLRSGSLGKVLVTSRKANVASLMGCSKKDILSVENLSDEECWIILNKIAFFEKSTADCKHLEEIGKKIASKCKGLPLAAKAVGSTLRFRETIGQWQNVLDSEIWKIEGGERDIIAPLWFSYYDLPLELKRCFSYCAIFPKDYEFIKVELIELWMTQGYLGKKHKDDLEVISENYFQHLVMRSFFQEFKYDIDNKGIIWGCKMHDMVHDLAQLVARDECVGVQVNSGQAESIIGSPSSKVRHLSLDCSHSTPSFKSFNGTKNLRSLFIWGSVSKNLRLTTEELSRLFSESMRVRSLILKYGDFTEIPSSICKLVQLRWLNVSWNDQLKQLPETLCELHSLQTIHVNWCTNLQQLPHRIGKLINLRHLHNGYGPCRLPKGIGELTGLMTLEWIHVGCYWDDDAFSLGDLKNLNQLQGKLLIKGLGAHDRHVGEAKQAELKKKEHITQLYLLFSRDEEGGEELCTPRNEELLLEALEPSPNLKILRIRFYKGTTFPGWMISLTNLRSIELWFCTWCEHVPSLGKLPSLETLVLGDMSGVKKVGVEVLGIEETQIGESKNEILTSASSSSVFSQPVVIAFPKLTTLEFNFMSHWKEWGDYYDGTTKPPPAIQIMPSLRSLEIKFCQQLKVLPDYILQNTNLHILEIKDCHLLKERYNKETGADWSKISHISHVEFE